MKRLWSQITCKFSVAIKGINMIAIKDINMIAIKDINMIAIKDVNMIAKINLMLPMSEGGEP
jgi:hypothetical protein